MQGYLAFVITINKKTQPYRVALVYMLYGPNYGIQSPNDSTIA